MSLRVFITGTDTDIGKTYISVGLLTLFNQMGYSSIGIKPLASGCRSVNNQLYNDDALALQQAASIKLPYQQINPYAFQPAIAPHLAAKQQACHLDPSTLLAACQSALAQPADLHLIEGVGGWEVPLSTEYSMADFAKILDAKIILVVGMRLGCLNHAILSAKAIQYCGLTVSGWIANCIDPNMPHCQENIHTLQNSLTCPFLGTVQHQQKVSDSIDFTILKNLFSLSCA